MFRAPSPFQRRLTVESLESRRQMAGVVELALDGGNWTLIGDGAANGIEIEQQAPGDFLIKGTYLGGETTKIKLAGFDNFVDTAFRVLGEVTNLSINLGGGGDRLRLVGRGPEGDALRVGNLLAINAADGDDEVQLKFVTVSGLSADLGAGHDELDVYGLTTAWWSAWYYSATGASIMGGTGKDRIEIEDSKLGRTHIDAGADNDAVLLEEVIAQRSLKILTGAGDDELAVIGGEFKSQLTIDTGIGNDEAALFAVSADEIFADMGDGDDYLYLVANEARAAKLQGGIGKDTLDFDPFIGINNEFEQLGTDGFEIVQ